MGNSREVPQKLKTELPHDLAILLLGIYREKLKTLTQKVMCTSLFKAALFAIAKNWKQPKCPSPNEWIKKMEYYSSIKKNEIMLFATTKDYHTK